MSLRLTVRPSSYNIWCQCFVDLGCGVIISLPKKKKKKKNIAVCPIASVNTDDGA